MDNFKKLETCMLSMGDIACAAQRQIVRNLKSDGSVVTDIDLEISNTIIELLANLFPHANVVSEETKTPFNESAALTFVLDPIDGTDVYSQGLPGWCIALGMLDKHRNCIGAMIHAPRWGLCRDEGLFLRMDPGNSPTLNGIPFCSPQKQGQARQTAVSSHAATISWKTPTDRKLRCYGSNILHMLSPVLYPCMDSAISTSCYAWDIAAAHAILTSQNMRCTLLPQSKPFAYDDDLLVKRMPFRGLLVSGCPDAIDELSSQLEF